MSDSRIPSDKPWAAMTAQELDAELDRLSREYLDYVDQFGKDTIRARRLKHDLLALETVLFLRQQALDN